MLSISYNDVIGHQFLYRKLYFFIYIHYSMHTSSIQSISLQLLIIHFYFTLGLSIRFSTAIVTKYL